MTEVVDPAVVEEPVDASANEPDPQAVEQPDADAGTPDTESAGEESRALSANQQAQVRRLIQHRDRQWQDYMQSAKGDSTDNNGDASEKTDELATDIRALYTNDDVGQKTFETIERHIQKRMGSNQSLSSEEVHNIAENAANKVRGQVQSGVAITNEVKALANQGVISTASEQRIVEKEYSNRLSDPQIAEAASTPMGAEMILKGVVYDLIKDKKIKPGAKRKQPTSPMQAGGNGSPLAASSKEMLDPQKSPFASVRALSTDDMKAAADVSRNNYSGARHG